MRHAILGAGGVGGLIAAALAKMGDPVTLILRPEAINAYPPELTLESPFGSFSVPVERATEADQPYDVLWIGVKATHLDTALRSVVAQPEAIGSIVPLLNGIDHIALLRGRFGHDRVVPASIAVESERAAPGKIITRSPGARLTISAIGESRLAPAVEKLRQFGLACKFDADEGKILWSKLAILAPFALTSTASGLSAGEINRNPEWRKRIEACVQEACAVSAASGTSLDAAAFIGFLDKLPAATRSSMQKDVAAGNPPELDAIAGPILRRAKEHGLAVPVITELAAMVRGKSAGTTGG